MNAEIKYLEWDSIFFNMKIGEVYINDKTEFSPQAQFDVVYVYSKNFIKEFNLVDTKIVYVIENIATFDDANFKEIEFYNPAIDDYQNILDLTLQSGQYSRFKTDQNFKNNQYYKLYKEWIDKSISKKLATDIIVKRKDNKIVGFTTLNRNSEELADISLVAVDRNYRKQGIAKELIYKSIYLAKSQGYKKLQVVTQLNNIPANKLYLKTGFVRSSINYIYHIWNHDTI